jgi:hypothetical protein
MRCQDFSFYQQPGSSSAWLHPKRRLGDAARGTARASLDENRLRSA